MTFTRLPIRGRAALAALCMLFMSALRSRADGNIDPTNKTAWAENAGWVNLAPTYGGVTVYYDGLGGHLSGYAWAENVGWIKLGHSSGGPYSNTGAADWGVNMAGNGDLSGYAWGENIGWVKFDPAYSQVTVDTETGRFSAYAWGENIGWIRFEGASPEYRVRTLTFDKQPLGSPNWWLGYHGVGETTDTDGDGMLAWQEWIADTIPTNAASLLRIVAISNQPPPHFSVYVESSLSRVYRLESSASLSGGQWFQAPGQWNISGNGAVTNLTDYSGTGPHYYRILVKLP